MAKQEVLAYLQDILDAISDVESFFADYPMRYDVFEKIIYAEVRLSVKLR